MHSRGMVMETPAASLALQFVKLGYSENVKCANKTLQCCRIAPINASQHHTTHRVEDWLTVEVRIED